MAKFDIPRFRYLFQDPFGEVQACTKRPSAMGYEWRNGGEYSFIGNGTRNTNWRNTLIDLDKDDYDFEDGILRRVEK